MPTKPKDRLLFAQGGKCFFCSNPLPNQDASVEHLLAVCRGGSNKHENLVVCCKALNSLFGGISLKEKLQIILNQHGNFLCPNRIPQNEVIKSPGTVRKLSDRNFLDTDPGEKI